MVSYVNYYKHRAPFNLRYVLESIDTIGPSPITHIAQHIDGSSNWPEVKYAVQLGISYGFIERQGLQAGTKYYLTERGRIALAIWRGKERKRIAAGKNGHVDPK